MDIDNLILVYVGSAAEFPLVPENDWLFYTGKLPKAPMERFIDTVGFNHRVFTSTTAEVRRMATQIRKIHTNLEVQRSAEEGSPHRMSNAAFKQVGAMLIDYGIRGFEYLHRRAMTSNEKELYYSDELEFLTMMGIENLAPTYAAFTEERATEIRDVLARNDLTDAFFASYRENIGWFKYMVLRFCMAEMIPAELASKLGIRSSRLFRLAYRAYPRLRCGLTAMAARFLFLTPEVRAALRRMEAINATLQAA